MKITNKTYYCPVCTNETKRNTNHFGEIYPTCEVCDCNTMYLKDKEHGFKFSMDGFTVKIVPYKFDLSIVSHQRMYDILKNHLENDLNYEICDVTAPSFGKSRFHEKSWNQSVCNIPVIKPEQFKEQYITSKGRLHQWFEYIFPNKNIVSGYYLILPSNIIYAKKE